MPEHTGYLVRVEGRFGSVLLYRYLQPVEALDFQNELRHEMQDGKNKWKIIGRSRFQRKNASG
jgi:hypothetical protein